MYDRELDEGLEEGARDTLAEIDAALQRIEDGTYGICEVCGKPIGADRLNAIPWTRLCIDDQRRAAG
jgi:RNA polymerase-binding protein DksA